MQAADGPNSSQREWHQIGVKTNGPNSSQLEWHQIGVKTTLACPALPQRRRARRAGAEEALRASRQWPQASIPSVCWIRRSSASSETAVVPLGRACIQMGGDLFETPLPRLISDKLGKPYGAMPSSIAKLRELVAAGHVMLEARRG